MKAMLRILFVVLALVPSPVVAADLVALADGNWTTGATWGVVDTTSKLISTSTATTALTTGNLDSTAFTPGAITIQGFLVRLALRDAGSPTNTMTLTLRNSTGSVDVQACVINVSDLPVTDTTLDQGGWVYCRFNTSAALAGATNYVIRAALSATSTNVSLSTDGTANNWQRMLVTTTPQAPAAGDDLHIAGWYLNSTSPATVATRTVTMDSTATTDHGSTNTDYRVPALSISKGGTLTYGTSASTNYVLRLSGHLMLFKGGTLQIGTTGTPIPRGGSAVLEFDGAGGNFGFIGRDGSTTIMQGSSPIAGTTATWGLLNTNEAIGQTVWGVDRLIAAASGGEVVILPTQRDFWPSNVRTLASDATASTVTVTAGLADQARDGVAPFQAEVASITRNVIVRATTAGGDAWINWRGAANVDIDWVLFRYLGNNVAFKLGVCLEHTSGTISIQYSVLRDQEIFGFVMGPEGGVPGGIIELSHNVVYQLVSGDTQAPIYMRSSTRTATITDNIIVPNAYMKAWSVEAGAQWTLISGNRMCCSNIGIAVRPGAVAETHFGGQPPFEDTVIHSMNQWGVFNDIGIRDMIDFDGLDIWRCASIAMYFPNGPTHRMTVKDFRFTGNLGGPQFNMGGWTFSDFLFENGQISGDTTFSSANGVIFIDGANARNFVFKNVDFGVGTGVYANHTTSDIYFQGGSYPWGWDVLVVGGYMRASTEVYDGTTYLNPSGIVRGQGVDSANRHFVKTHFGSVESTATGCDAGRCIVMTPTLATSAYKLLSSGLPYYEGWRIPVASGNTIAVSIKGKKNGAYNGNPARLMLKSNPAIGLTTETVCDTHSAAADTFETLTCAVPTVTADGFVELYIDVDGSAGTYTVDTFTVTGSVSMTDGLEFWASGIPALGSSGAGGSTPVEVSHPFQ
jgi:hypothetical protein